MKSRICWLGLGVCLALGIVQPTFAQSYTNEPPPNGGRVNAGLYGGTAEASKSRENDWLFAMTFNDGGSLIQTGRLEWVGGNLGAGATVNLEYSTNNGTGWSTIANGLAATNESYTWAPAFAHAAVLWRVVNATNAACASTNAKPFSVRPATNTAFSFYVNDGSTANDVYCSAVGAASNLGVASNAPKASLMGILTNYSLRGGDVVYVDTGTYAGQTVVIGGFDSGRAGSPMRILGSPNGVVLDRMSAATVLDISGASFLEIENLALTGGSAGLYGSGASDITLRNVQFRDNQTGVSLAGAAVRHVFERCLAANNSSHAFLSSSTAVRSNQWLNGVMWNSQAIIHAATNQALTVSNSILGQAGTALFGNQAVAGNHNVVWDLPLTNGVGGGYVKFTALQSSTLGWDRCAYADPLFANTAGGDYHLRSPAGRYDTNLMDFVMTDTNASPAIDLGDPAEDVTGIEPDPNGSRLNAGLYGGTAQASKSRTNAWLQLLTYMDGAPLSATDGAWVRWDGGQYETNATVRILLSRDSGLTWEVLETNVTASLGSFFYQEAEPDNTSSYSARLRVELEDDPEAGSGTGSESPMDFIYRNGSFAYYINDASTAGDMYCGAPGSDSNVGTSSNLPMANLHALVAKFITFGPGDRIYIDTGSYTATNPVVLGPAQSGTPSDPIVIEGSTNRLAGGTVFGASGSARPMGFEFQSGASNLVLRDIIVTNRQTGILMGTVSNLLLHRVEVRGGTSRAFDLNGSRHVTLSNCVAHGGGAGVYLNNARVIAIRHGVFWENSPAIQRASGTDGFEVRNSILGSTRTGGTLFSLNSATGFTSDYNGLYAGPNTRVGTLGGAAADNAAAWQSLTGGQDRHSVPGEPQMANPGAATAEEFAYDYHLKTEETLGRLRRDGTRKNDTTSSPLLDAGDPEGGAGEEPEPNGGRVNIGVWGGTEEASKAPATAPWLRTASFGDGGSVSSGVVRLVWTAGGGFSNQTATVEVSVDGGESWASPPAATNVPITNGWADWTVAGLPATPGGAWRVVCEQSTNQWARSTNFFAIRTNGSLDLYVATVDTNNNVYAGGAGATNHWMASAEAPMLSLRSVFDRFDLEPGDRIWVDPGVYPEDETIAVGMKNSGSAASPVRVIGDTNRPYQGTFLARTARTTGSSVFQISRAGGIHLEALTVSNAWRGIRVDNTGKAVLEKVRGVSCGTNTVEAGAGANLELSRVILEKSLVSGLHTFTGATVTVRHSLFRDHALAGFFLRGGSVEVRNSILEAEGAGQHVFYTGGPTALDSDYNNVRATDGANVAGGDNQPDDRFLIDWQLNAGQDPSSFGYAALFADAGGYDFHLKSEYGRFDPAEGAFTTNDTETSRLIDLGDAAPTNEPSPDGGKVNVGLHGDTPEASKSSGTGALVPLTMSDGGTIRGDATLYWAWIGLAGNERVTVDFSWDGGVSWTNIAEAYADDGTTGLPWATTNFQSTAMGVWRVCTTNGAVCGQTETLFALKNDPLKYYVNDGSAAGDVYCTDIGRSTHSGLSSNEPLNSLATLLARYKVEHGDTVYVDTGVYPRSTPLEISISSAEAVSPLVIQGSTNEAAGGTVFTNSGGGAVLTLLNSRNVELRDLRLRGGGKGLLLNQASSNRIVGVRAEHTRGNAFELGLRSDQNDFVRCAALHFMSTGLHVATPLTVQTPSATNRWSFGVIASRGLDTNGIPAATSTLVGVKSGRLTVSNSVLVAQGPLDTVYDLGPDVFGADYNAYHRVPGALLARVSRAAVFGISSLQMDHLNTWAAWSGVDSNSLAADPLFADLDGGDLHPRSEGGRWDLSATNWVADDATSPLVDLADPAADFGLEPTNNGSRANLGVYGGTAFASRSPEDPSFVLLALNEGGVVSNTVTLKWQARGAATNGAASIWLSTNSGANWDQIGTNPAAAGSYAWDTTTNRSIPTARWQVRHLVIPGVETESDRDFLIHNEPLIYYVNDGSLSNDLWCSAVGSAAHTGLAPDSPLPSLEHVLDRYDLEPGDTVRLDTGEYLQTSPTRLGYLDSGSESDPVVIEGSSQHPGTVIQNAGLALVNARGVEARRLRIQTPSPGAVLADIAASEDILFEEVDLTGGAVGAGISGSSNVWFRHFSAVGATTNGVESYVSYGTYLEFGTIWSNGNVQVLSSSSPKTGIGTQPDAFVSVSNCILGAFGLRKPVYNVRGALQANYNSLFLTNGALAALTYESGITREHDSVGRWTEATGLDSASLSHVPRFANAPAGDFHLRTQAPGGRWDPAAQAWTNDAVSSPLIDAGDPGWTVGDEPPPNGGRVNLGRYGRTAEASKTPTNGTLTLVSFNDGGRASGTNVWITWLARGAATNAGVTVTIWFSADGGATWTNLAAGISSTNGQWVWNSETVDQTVQGLLRIEGSDGSVTQSDQFFSIRNKPFRFYINDNDTTGDEYCSQPGSNVNSGLTNSAPMADLNALLAKYDLEGGDIVFIDTGVYAGGGTGGFNPWRITQADSAGTLTTNPVVIQGSTNFFPSRTVLNRNFRTGGIQVDYAIGVELRNITVSNAAGSAVSFNNSFGVTAEWMAVGGGDTAFSLSGGSQLRVAHNAVYDTGRGVAIEGQDIMIPDRVAPLIEHNVLWDLASSCIAAGANDAVVRHNILSASAGRYIYELSTVNGLTADYNAIWLANGGRVSRQTVSRDISPLPIVYETVGAWSEATGRDQHTYDGDPLVANAAGLDFHLKSQAPEGRWDPALQVWTNDAVTSPLVDAGRTNSASWTNEPSPNGGRVNIGLYGGTSEASRTATNAALHLLSLNNGGVASGQVALNWMASGAATGHTVRLSVSTDDGESWTVVAEGLPAGLGGIDWYSPNLPVASSPFCRWRVESEQEAEVEAVSAQPFVLHNAPIAYYVNDDSTTGDAYCSAPGASTNTGTSAASPKRWIKEILDTFNLEPGDVIYVDTGDYVTTEPIVVGDLDGGQPVQDAGQHVTVRGNPDGGTLIITTEPDQSAFELSGTVGVRLEHLEVIGAANALSIQGSYFIAGEWLVLRSGQNGIRALSSSNLVFNHCVLSGNQGAGIRFSDSSRGILHMGSSVLWSNRHGIYLDQGYVVVSNSVFGLTAPASYAYYMRSDPPFTGIRGDYNNLYAGHAESVIGAYQKGPDAVARTTLYYSVSGWTAGTGQDPHSLPHNPQFANPGGGDFHLRSLQGRWQPGGGWVNDTESSPLIDAGNPRTTDWTAESDPNGRRLNIGLYGGTPEASRTPMGGFLTLISLNDGGSASGPIDLRWAAGGAATNATLCLEYSPDNGITWSNIICGWPASEGSYPWNSEPYGASALGRWRATIDSLGIQETSLAPFLLRNGGQILYYVNDASTVGDVYCTAPGSDGNDGLTPGTPKATLQSVLSSYDLEPVDVVYVDAGDYTTATITIGPDDSGWSNQFVTIQGSTNPAAPTRMWGSSFQLPAVFHLSYAENVRLQDLTIRNAAAGIQLTESTGCEFDRVRIENNRGTGLDVEKSTGIRLLRSVLWKNLDNMSGAGVAVRLRNLSSLAMENCTVWGHPNSVSFGQGTSLTVTNSVLDADGTSGRIYQFDPFTGPATSFQGDYNCYSRKNGALIADKPYQTGGNDLYNDLPTWGRASGSEQHSMTLEPAFHSEVNGDFHPRSTRGRFTLTGWANDSTNSPLIDAGHPARAATNEPAPNGGLINIGAYGGTPEASMTQTNPPWLRVVSYNESGETLSGNALLYWLHGGMESNALVQLDYTTDQWTWHSIASNLAAGSRQYEWDVSEMPLTVGLYWRVVLQSQTNIFDESDAAVAVKTTNYTYYINDDSTVGDVWCNGVGRDWDPWVTYGTNPATPLKSLKVLLDHLPVGGGDKVYIDTGVYPVASSNAIVLDDRNMGTAISPLEIFGSPNMTNGGTLLLGNGTASGLRIRNTRHIHLNDLRIGRAQNGLLLENVATIRIRGGEFFRNLTNGVSTSGSSGLELSNSLIWGNGGFGYQSTAHLGAQSIENATLWGNRLGAVENSLGTLQVRNSILSVTNDAPVYSVTGPGDVAGDFNLFWNPAGGPLATNSVNRVAYDYLSQWQAKGSDGQSLRADPLFVNPAATNFHLQSRAGYWSNGSWPTSSQTSWAIDAGDPASPGKTNEWAPNGGRINLGAYGGTPYASKSDDSVAELLPVSFSDGGVATAYQPLYWLFRGLSATNRVCVEYSPDGGGTWTNIQCGVGIGTTNFHWESSAEPTPEALWRLVLEADPGLTVATTELFTHRTTNLTYYVNDDSLEGDVFTGEIGAFANLGYTSNSPLESIQQVLDRFSLSPGDEVKVDTGVYVIDEPVTFSILERGTAALPVRFRGSTNPVVRSRFEPGSGMDKAAFIFFDTDYVDLSGFHVVGFNSGVSFEGTEGSEGCRLQDLDIQGSSGPGLFLARAGDIQMERVLVREGQADGVYASQSRFTMDGCVIWSNQGSAVSMGQSVQVGLTNSVLEAAGLGNYCYYSATSATIRANYNNLVIRDGAQIASINNRQYARLPQWSSSDVQGKQDRFSLGADPRFHDPANGDFHLRSIEGRYQPGTGWVQDVTETNLPDFSPLIDMGAPQTAWSNEPVPHGERRNIGLYGHTWQASRSDTNDWIQAITASDGGLLAGGFYLTWGYNNVRIPSGTIVRVDYMAFDDGSENWIPITESVAIGQRQVWWQSDQLTAIGTEKFDSSPAGTWRIWLDAENYDETDRYFGLRNNPFKYYVNDESLAGDVYATAVGDDDNLGFFPAGPKLTLQALLEDVDLEETDQVYIDTGIYAMSDTNKPIRWEVGDGGQAGGRVQVFGSPGGSLFAATNKFSSEGFFFMEASHVDLRDLRFAGESLSFSGDGLIVSNVVLTNRLGTTVSLSLQSSGSSFHDIQIDRGAVTLSGTSNRLERLRQRWGETAVTGTDVAMLNSAIYTTNRHRTALTVNNSAGAAVSNCSIVASQGTALEKRGGGTLHLGHNILVAGGTDTNSVIVWSDGPLLSDWNNLRARGSAWVGVREGKWERLAYWQAVSGQDANSVSFEPEFAWEERGDLHLKSATGYWNPLLGQWETNAVHSPLIDLGSPWSLVGPEPTPNGYRRNLGAYGGTGEASKSRESFWLTALTANDGGVLKGTNIVLQWAVSNNAPQTVRLDYSWDGGTTWSNIVTGWPATERVYTWDTTGFPDGFNGLWRVVAEDGSWGDTNDTAFALRNFTQDFFVNDASQEGDIYTDDVGNDGNDGLTALTPKATLQAVLDAYDLEAGDRVFIDTGNYSSETDLRVIWSRSGEPGDPVVIQGNTNGAYTVMTRSAATTNYPAIGIDVKASDIELRDLVLRGMNRGILLESNRNALVDGAYLIDNQLAGVTVQGSQGTIIRKSALWQGGWGVDLANTRTTRLENLTFALPVLAGIRLSNTVEDVVQNNVFIPAEGAFAYSVGSVTTLLSNAEIDYNLYDFGNTNTGFYAGWTNDLRTWQVGMNADFRSAMTDAGLVRTNDYPWEAGDLHPRSEYGRWTNSPTGAGLVYDEVDATSWAVDHGNPDSAWDQEPGDNGGRINIGMYGNSIQASLGSTSTYFDVRTLDGEVDRILLDDPLPWPLVWSSHLVGDDVMVLVQFNGGATNASGELVWTTLASNILARQEYFIWRPDVTHQTANGIWRVIAEEDPALVDASTQPFIVSSPGIGFRGRPYRVFGLMRFDWEGGIPGINYRIEYSDDFGETWQVWETKYNGPAQINMSQFSIAVPQAWYTFEDRTSYQNRQRWYRISRESEGD